MVKIQVEYGNGIRLIEYMQSNERVCAPTCPYIPLTLASPCRLWGKLLVPTVMNNQTVRERCADCIASVIE